MNSELSPIARAFLGVWLNRATAGLTLPVAERIRLEIRSHFEDAVESHIAGGLSTREAESAALAALGDPKEARGQFHRRHLTAREADTIDRLLRQSRLWNSGWRLPLALIGYVVFFCMVALLGRHWHASPLVPAFFGVVNATLLVLYFSEAKKGCHRLDLRRLVSLCMLLSTTLAAFFGWYSFQWMPSAWLALIVVGSFIPQVWSMMRLWLKLRRVADIWQEMPPSKPVAPLSETA